MLTDLHFDAVNRELRLPTYGGDYDLRPFPLPGSPVDVADMKVRLRQAVKASPDAGERRLARRIQYAFTFFMFGEALPRDRLAELFGDETTGIDEGLELGLFISEQNTVRTNGLSLFSRRLRNGGAIHLFADTPPHFERRMSATPRVYIGADSYELMERVAALVGRGGCCMEMGSGSGIQLISALKHHPLLTTAVGKERDRRALNVSAFNAALNGVAGRMVVVGPEADLGTELNGRTVAFAMTNPPFLPVPAELDVKSGDEPIDLHAVFPSAGWGGEDGLEVTGRFIDELQPLLGPDVPCIIYSQFAGDDHGPAQVRRYAERAGFDFTFEPLPSRRVRARDPDTNRVVEGSTQPVLSAAQAAASTARLIVAALLGRRVPQRIQSAIRRGSPEHALLLSLAATLEKSYIRHGITHFHDGFAILTRS